MIDKKDKMINILLRYKPLTFGDRTYDGIQFTIADVIDLLKEQQKTIRKLEHCRLCRQYSCDGCKYL